MKTIKHDLKALQPYINTNNVLALLTIISTLVVVILLLTGVAQTK